MERGASDIMYSVTQRIRAITQPRLGYLPVNKFSREPMGDMRALNFRENVHPALIGLTVDYLSRLVMGENPREAFNISLMGARILGKEVHELPTDLSDESIKLAVRLSSFDVAVRASPSFYKETDMPDKKTMENIRILTERVVSYFKDDPIVWSGFTFEGGYTDTIVAGDGDWLTKDTLWDLKVLRNEPNPDHTLQLLIYWLMGLESEHPIYQDIKYLAIINPRSDAVHRLNVSDIDQDVIDTVNKKVIVI